MYFKTAVVEASKICIRFNVDRSEHLKILSYLKSVYGMVADKDDSGEWYWCIPDNDRNQSVVNNLGFTVQYNSGASGLMGISPLLREYQKTGVRFFDKYNGSALLGDDMGLGKTCQALSYVAYRDRYPLLIICPASLKLNWQAEYSMWCGDKESVAILSGKKSYLIGAKVAIINYDILTYWQDTLLRWHPKQIIADEVQKIKKISGTVAKRTAAFIRICRDKQLIALSGTPMENRTYEFFNILNLLRPKMFPSAVQYGARFCGTPSRNRYTGYTEYKGSKNMTELNFLLKSVMLRRLKKDVLKELPSKTRVVVSMELDTKLWKEYSVLEDKTEKSREMGTYLEIRNTIEALKQIAVRMKMKSVIKWIKNYLEESDKLVVFGIHKIFIAELMKEFGDIAVKIDGSVSGKKRHEAVQRFQNDSTINLMIGNLQAAGVGLTLTAASATVTFEFDYGPSAHIQAEDRIYRFGQQADAVFAYYLIAKGTIEEKLMEMIDKKQRILDKVLDGKSEKEEFPLLDLLSTSVQFKRRPQLVGI